MKPSTPLFAFLGGTAALTILLQVIIIFHAHTIRSFYVIPLMWTPGLVAAICSKYFGFGLRDLAILKPKRKPLLYAYFVPVVAALLTLLLLVLCDIGKFNWPEYGLAKILIVEPTLGVLAGAFLAFGEELGWRGFLHSHLIRNRVPHPILVTGLIWAVWHWPLILFADYSTSNAPLLSVVLFSIMIVSFAVFLGWLREYSRSVVPAIVAHAAHNTFIQSVYPSFYTPGKLDPYFGGESGFILAILYLLMAIYLYRKYPLSHF